MPYRRNDIRRALRHLRRADPVMREIIRRVGPFRLRVQADRYAMLVRSIVIQQISGQAARAVFARLEAAAGGQVGPEPVLRLKLDGLRAVGLSRQKAAYVLDLSKKVRAGEIDPRNLGRFADERVIEQLTRVKGIGRWTAQMFLIFALGRLDVFPHDDLGIRVALRDFYGLEELPGKAASQQIAAPWRPFATVASWYCWRGLEAEAKMEAERE